MSLDSANLENMIQLAHNLVANDKEKQLTREYLQAKVEIVAKIYLEHFHISVTEEEKQAMIPVLLQRNAVWVGEYSAITDHQKSLPWVPSTKEMWEYWKRYKIYIQKKIPQCVVDEIDRSTDQILNLLRNPHDNGPWDRRGLVVGHVQSGKTSNYTGLICKAADAGYKMIIVLAGMHNNLRAQTQIRLEEGFLGIRTPSDSVKLSEFMKNGQFQLIGVGKINQDSHLRPDFETTRAEKGDFDTKKMQHGTAPGSRPCLCVVKKNVTVLQALNKWISERLGTVTMECDGQTRKFIPDIPLLVIDDEADNASVDTQKDITDASGNPDKNHNPSAINAEIRKLLRNFGKSAYVGYTATPFANIFIHNRAATDEHGNDLFPSAFIVNLSPSSNYMGPSKFFGRPIDDDVASPLNALIHHIPFTENWVADWHKKNYRLPVLPDFLPESLQNAVMSFVLSCIVRKCRGDGKKHCSMLIHVTRFKDVQSQVYNAVRDYVKRIHNRLRNGLNAEITIDAFRNLWENDFMPVTNTMLQSDEEGIRPSDSGIVPLPPWNEVEAMLEEMLGEISRNIYCINGSSNDILNYEESSEEGLRTIVIGGDKLSRGLTLEGLTISYFLRASRMYDTLMQMGRWFGYRTGYLDVCRLYLTQPLEYWFTAITEAGEELREEFNIAIQRNLTPEEYGLKVLHHPALMVTSPLKMRTAQEMDLSLSGTLQETVNFFRDDSVLQKNLDALSTFLKDMGPWTTKNVQRDRGTTVQTWGNSVLWKGVPVSKVLDFLDQYKTHPAARKAGSEQSARFIREMNQSGELREWNVAIIGGNTHNVPVQLAPGIQIKPVSRRAATITENGYSIGCLPSSRDESIDLEKSVWEKALAMSKEAWKRDPGNAKKEPDSRLEPSFVAFGDLEARILRFRQEGHC